MSRRSRVGRVVALVVAGGLAAAVLTGRADLLVRPWFGPVLLATAVLIALVAVRRLPTLTPTSTFLLLAPVVVGLTLTPGVVGRVSHGTADTTSLAARVADGANPLLAGRGGDVTLLQILLAEQEVGGVALAGRTVTVDALVGGPHTLQRSVIVCCAADAQTVRVSTSGAALPASHDWVRVTGRLRTTGDQIVLDASSVRRIPTPGNPFL